MNFRRELIGTFLIQGVGAASVFITIALIAATLGVVPQGQFSLIKTEVEFVTALSMMGMPQAMLYFLRAGGLTHRNTYRITAWLSVASFFVAFAYAALTRTWSFFEQILFAIAVASMVVHGLLRIVVLASGTTRAFNVVTVAPQFFVLFLVVLLVFGGLMQVANILTVFLIAHLVGSFVAWQFLGKPDIQHSVSPVVNAVTVGQLAVYGLAAWSVAVMSSSAYVLWLRHVESTLGLSDVGTFAMGLMLVQVVLVPFTYAAPVLFKRWVGRQHSHVNVWRPAIISSVGVALILTVLVLVIGVFSASIPLGQYAKLSELAWFLTIAASAEVAVRVAAVACYSDGKPWFPAIAELVRLMWLGVGVAGGFAHTLDAVVILWSAGAVLAATTLIFSASVARSRTGESCETF